MGEWKYRTYIDMNNYLAGNNYGAMCRTYSASEGTYFGGIADTLGMWRRRRQRRRLDTLTDRHGGDRGQEGRKNRRRRQRRRRCSSSNHTRVFTFRSHGYSCYQVVQTAVVEDTILIWPCVGQALFAHRGLFAEQSFGFCFDEVVHWGLGESWCFHDYTTIDQ